MAKKVLAILFTVCFCLLTAVVSGASDGVVAQGDYYTVASPCDCSPCDCSPCDCSPCDCSPCEPSSPCDCEPVTPCEPVPVCPPRPCCLQRALNWVRNLLYRLFNILHISAFLNIRFGLDIDINL